MKTLAMAAVIVGTLAGATLTSALPASARDEFSFSFNTGDFRFAYSDGYWDNDRNWHSWRNAREAREYRVRHKDRYNNHRHNKHRNKGWRESDGDGVPNRHDDAPRNPNRD